MPRKVLTSTLMLLMVVLLGVGSGCATDQQVIAQAADVHHEIEPAVLEDKVLNEYMTQIGRRIQAVAREMSAQGTAPKSHSKGDTAWMFGPDVEFHLVASDTLNAFTTGGKHIYLYTELLESCKNEDEFAAVVAHEFAHIYGRHVHKGMNRQYATLGAAAAAGGAGYLLGGENAEQYAAGAAGLALVGGQFIGMGFTRGDENEADEFGFQMYTRAGWDPNKFAGFFQTMIDKGYDTTPEFASDHPSLKNRVAATKERIRELPPNAKNWRRSPVAKIDRFKQLQARAAQMSKRVPQDKSLEQAKLMLAAFPSCVAPVAQPEQREAKRAMIQEAERRERPAP